MTTDLAMNLIKSLEQNPFVERAEKAAISAETDSAEDANNEKHRVRRYENTV